MDTRIPALRAFVDDYLARCSFSSASFYADILASYSKAPEDIYRQANCFYKAGEYKRAFHVLNKSNITKLHAESMLLAALCLIESSEWDECLELLAGITGATPQLRASFCIIRGKVFIALEQRQHAKAQWIEALAADPKCIESYHLLASHCLLTSEDTISLLHSLKFDESDSFIKDILLSHVAKYKRQPFKHFENLKKQHGLETCVLVNTLRAETFYYQNNFSACYKITNGIVKDDPCNYGDILLLHISSMVELGKKNDLFLTAHQLSEAQPGSCCSHYAIGAYYYCLGNNDKARTHFSKATLLDPNFVPAWIGYGHSFAIEDEHDQAMAGYRAGFRITSSHMPPLFIGMELIRVRNFAQATHFLSQAMKLNPLDPLVFNEMGVIALYSKNYDNAIEYFLTAIQLCGTSIADIWEATYTNLGHSYRKKKMFPEAKEAYQKGLNLAPTNPEIRASLFSALGFTSHLSGELDEAINYYQQSLGYNPTDRFTLDLLSQAIATVTLPL